MGEIRVTDQLSRHLLVFIIHRSEQNWQIRGYPEEEVYKIRWTSFHITSYSANKNKWNNNNTNLSWDWENNVQAHNPVSVNVINKVYKHLQRCMSVNLSNNHNKSQHTLVFVKDYENSVKSPKRKWDVNTGPTLRGNTGALSTGLQLSKYA